MKLIQNIMIGVVSIVLSITFAGCAASGYKTSYKPYSTNEQLIQARLNPDFLFLNEGEEPQVYSTDNFYADIKKFRAKGYMPIGASIFNGEFEDTKNAITQAKQIGATLVLLNSLYTNTETRTSTMTIPYDKTTYISGNIDIDTNENTNYFSSFTTYGTREVPYTTSTRQYIQSAMYFVKNTKKFKFGIEYKDMSRKQRITIGKTGVFISLIMENSPVYNSNILEGDLVIKFDGIKIKDSKHFLDLISKFKISKNHSIWTIIRDGKQNKITINFK